LSLSEGSSLLTLTQAAYHPKAERKKGEGERDERLVEDASRPLPAKILTSLRSECLF